MKPLTKEQHDAICEWLLEISNDIDVDYTDTFTKRFPPSDEKPLTKEVQIQLTPNSIETELLLYTLLISR